jgi:hypothetical protein
LEEETVTRDRLPERYPPALRAELVEWARRQGPADRVPPEVVRSHLTAVLRAAARTGRRRGVLLGLLLGWLPVVAALALLVAAALLAPALPVP